MEGSTNNAHWSDHQDDYGNYSQAKGAGAGFRAGTATPLIITMLNLAASEPLAKKTDAACVPALQGMRMKIIGPVEK
jgi:hypothetical protein